MVKWTLVVDEEIAVGMRTGGSLVERARRRALVVVARRGSVEVGVGVEVEQELIGGV